MRKTAFFAIAAVLAAGLALIGNSPVDAGGGSTVYAVHGLNLAGQSAQGDGGTNVTVCTGSTELVGNFEFGQVLSLGSLPTGADVPVQVYLQQAPPTPVDCGAPGAAPKVIDQVVTVPAGTAALVATSMGNQLSPELVPFALNTDCVEPGTGRLTAAHAANAPTVDVLVDGGSAGELDYSEQLEADLPAGTVQVQVDLAAGGTVVPSTSVEILEANNRIAYVVGAQPANLNAQPEDDGASEGDTAGSEAVIGSTPVVVLVQDLDLDTCEPPDPGDEQPADVVRARPAFTG